MMLQIIDDTVTHVLLSLSLATQASLTDKNVSMKWTLEYMGIKIGVVFLKSI